MVATNAVDMSKHGGPLTDQEAECMKAAGIKTIIVASGPGGYSLHAKQQAEMALSKDLGLEVYGYIELAYDPVQWADDVIDRVGVPIDKVERWWADMEDDRRATNWTPQQRAAYWQQSVDRMDARTNRVTGVYSGRWYWNKRMQGITQFADQGRLLWNSWYDGDPDIDGVPYGGWIPQMVAIEQFSGTTMVCGQSVDRNHIYLFPGGPPITENDLEARTAALERQMDLFNEAVTWRDDLRRVAAGPYAEMQRAHVALNAAGLIPPRET